MFILRLVFIYVFTGLVVLAFCPAARAQGPVVSYLSRNGELVATNLPLGSGADVEWAPTVNGPWTNSWTGLRNLLPDSNSSIRVSVPMVYRVRSVPTGLPLPSDLVLIPAGTFAMGDSLDGLAPAVPVHYVQVGDYWISRHEVTKALWDEVYNWAIQNGYSFQYGGQGKAANHPVHSVTWYDAVKWCNARSEKEGQVPAYYTSAAQNTVYRSGQVNVQNDWVKWSGGYRLPTEAEWEKAARGGIAGQRFPWGNTITHAKANYVSDSTYAYDVSPSRGFHPSYEDVVYPFTSPVGSFGANGYGLHDMIGNVWEWCWDGYDAGYYGASPELEPVGPSTGSSRVLRGGSWSTYAVGSRSPSRNYFSPGGRFSDFGFRVVLGPAGIAFAAGDFSGPEGGFVTLTVLRQGGLGRAVSVDYATVGGTALAGLDFTAVSGTLSFGPNEPTRTFVVPLIEDSMPEPEESFTVVLQNPQGGARILNPAAVVVRIGDPPVVLQQPVSQTNFVGDTTGFIVTASGTEPLSYQWRLNGVAIAGGMNASLVLVNVQPGQAGDYDVVVANAYGSVTSSVAVLTVVSLPPVITEQPVSRTNVVGTMAVFSVVGAGTSPLSYQWRRDGVTVAGGANAMLALANVQTNQAGNYDVVVANAYGSVTSSVAVLTVVTVPAITQQPVSRTNMVGTTADFAVAAAGTSPLSYQWRRGGVAVAGGTGAALTLANLQTNQAGDYDVVVANAYGSVTSSVAVLTVVTVPTITQQPVSRTNQLGTTADFAVVAAGTPPLSYQWRRGGVAVVGGTGAALTLANVQTNQAGNYDVVVANAYGSVTSSVAVLTVVLPLPVPSGMVLIPAGSFAMGDALDGDSTALPVHTVTVGPFYMDRTEVTKALWAEVYGWAVTNGYSFESTAGGKAANHPAQEMTWYDAVKWCNARSEKEGLVPAYYREAGRTNVYRSGLVNVPNGWVRWTNGYRLPTEAEWEKAARGGVAGQRFGFGDTIAHVQANYNSSTSYAYDVSSTWGYHPTYNDGVFPYTSPVGSFGTNGYGLSDMAGNVWEWCWDWYGSSYYSSSPAADPQGPLSGSYRVLRGGSYYSGANYCRSAYRDYYSPDVRSTIYGFRAVLPSGQP